MKSVWASSTCEAPQGDTIRPAGGSGRYFGCPPHAWLQYFRTARRFWTVLPGFFRPRLETSLGPRYAGRSRDSGSRLWHAPEGTIRPVKCKVTLPLAAMPGRASFSSSRCPGSWCLPRSLRARAAVPRVAPRLRQRQGAQRAAGRRRASASGRRATQRTAEARSACRPVKQSSPAGCR